MIRVAVLGTCRVYDPLIELEKSKYIRVLPRFWGFPHCSSEVLQHLRLAKGLLEVPKVNFDVLNLTHLKSLYFKNGARNMDVCIDKAEMVFIEISSKKHYKLGEFSAQGNRIAEAVGLHLFDVDKVLFKKQNDDFSENSIKQLEEFKVEHETDQTLKDNIHEIMALLKDKHIVFTTVFTVDDEKRDKFGARVEIRDIVRKLVNEAQKKGQNVSYYDPTNLLVLSGMPIKDYSHYETKFIKTLSVEYRDLIYSKVSRNWVSNLKAKIASYTYFFTPTWLLTSGRHKLYLIFTKLAKNLGR